MRAGITPFMSLQVNQSPAATPPTANLSIQGQIDATLVHGQISMTDRLTADRVRLKALLAKDLEERCKPLHMLRKEHSTIRHKLVSLLDGASNCADKVHIRLTQGRFLAAGTVAERSGTCFRSN